jgi:O-methyltransferase
MHNDAALLYIDLLKKSVLGELYVENEVRILYLKSCLAGQQTFDLDVFLDPRAKLEMMCQEYVHLQETGIGYGLTLHNLGFQHTMIGLRRLENIEFCLSEILAQNIPGDCIECGVWRGGAVIFMKGYLDAHRVEDRSVWVADSFQGPPKPSLEEDAGLDLSREQYPMLGISLETVRDLFQRYGLLDDRVHFLPGWFKETLPTAPIERIALLRVDGDLFESTRDVLEVLYDRVSPGGFILIDDYGCLAQCRRAVTAFRESRAITEPIQEVDWTGVFWRKER